ncbi:phage holin family protein [Sporosarcina sp. YIM B06819]|uniref:phage holin family protein n=1 Tax=Sporosarcina sp. YIM B06819 TaxID=3081769 RepID=UPI00298CA355|nr:phage holin family protein [Sporosarcina sp. YIM B06819]
MNWFGKILLNAVFFLVLSWLIPSFIVSSIWTAILASVVLAIINVIVRPILIILTLPATIITLGLFLFVINALMLLLTNKIIGDGFIIEGFGTALVVAFLMTLLNIFVNPAISNSKSKRR